MGFKEVLSKLGSRNKERKELLKRMLDQDKLESIVEERKKSSNQRELERYFKENQEKEIREQLQIARKARQDDISFNHNPLDVKNITAGTEWQVLREKNMFNKKQNMFANQPKIHKSNKNLLKSGNVLHGKNLFKHGGGNLI